MVSEWVAVVRAELPLLAPRPPGCGFGSRAARRRAGGGEGWKAGPEAWAAGTAAPGGDSGGRGLLLSYLDELRASAIRQGTKHAPLAGSRPYQPYGSAVTGDKLADSAPPAWEDLEVLPDEEELRMLDEEQQQERVENMADEGPAVADNTPLTTSVSVASIAAPSTTCIRPVDAALVLLSADSAALGIWLGGQLVRHKILTGCTVRHSAGGSQARRDRRVGGGGGRSVGAALRRAEAARLWQATAARLAEWAPELAACRVLVRSGDTRVFAQLYEARRPPPPIDLRDPRWEGAGVSVPRPRLRDLLAVHRRISTGRVEWLLGPSWINDAAGSNRLT